MNDRKYQICTNCVMDTTDTEIVFDENGRCDFCDSYYNSILPSWHPDERGARDLGGLVAEMKRNGQGKKYDCIIGLSGGVDSCYLTYVAKEKLGLRPLLLSVDTGWNLTVANDNVQRLVTGLNLDLHTVVVDWEEMKDLQVAFLKSQVPWQDFPQDEAIFSSLYNYAVANGIKYVMTGANYSTECVRAPSEWVGLNDLRFMRDVHDKYGKRPLKNFPMCGMFKYRLYYQYVKGMRIVKPLNMIPYDKQKAVAELEQRFGWQTYANKHYEDIFTRFFEGYWLPKTFGYDKRKCDFSSLILTGQMSRQAALEALAQPPYDEDTAMQDLEYILDKLGMDRAEYTRLMNGEKRTYRDFKNNEGLIRFAIKLARLVGMEKRNYR